MALNSKKVLIVGGGASGVISAIQILRSRASVDVDLAEPNDQLGLGVAYSTTDFAHLLNVPASRMSAVEADPNHFMEWADAKADQFVPRALFGEYLEETLNESITLAREEKIFTHIQSLATSIGQAETGWIVGFADGSTGDYSAIIFATGLSEVNSHSIFNVLAGNPRVIDDVWATSVPTDFKKVAILGTGLTFVDQALSMLTANSEIEIVAISRDGLLPFSHAKPNVEIRSDGLEFPTARSIVDFVNSHQENWREAQDSLRSRFPLIWHELADSEKSDFLEIYLSWWKYHRHRIAPEIYTRVIDALNAKRLQVIKGRIQDFDLLEDSIKLTLTRGEILYVDAVLNCTGNKMTITNRLLKDLILIGLLAPGPLDAGVACDFETLRLKSGTGKVHDSLYGIGPILLGELFETTAIPEIRSQAANIADQLAK